MNAEATRMFEPQIEEMNNAGRAVQRQQGGSIPEYKADGGGVDYPYDYKRDRWGQIIPGGYELDNLVSPSEDAAIAALKAGVSSEDVYNLSGIRADMIPNEEPPVSIDNDYLASVGLGSVPTQEEILRRTVGPSTIDSLFNSPLDVPKPDGPMMEPMGNVTAEQMAERALDRRREAKEAGYPGQQEAVENLTTSFKDIYKPKNWQEREALDKEEVVPAVDPYRLEVDVDAINNPEAEPEDDDTTISGLIAAGNEAKGGETPEGEGEVVGGETKEPSAWDKVKDFFKEGFGTILDKGALSEAATLYLGSRALGYGHEGSLNFVAKRYGKGIEDKIAIANKAVGTYTPESITKYKDTGNLNDLALIKTLTDLDKPVSYVVPATGEILDYRQAKNEKGVTVTVDNQNNVVDTKKLLTADEYRARSEDNRKQLTSLFDGAKRKLTATNTDDEDFDADALFNTAEVAKAASQHALANGFNTAEVSKQAPYIVKFITEAKRSGNPLYKDVSDMDLTNIALTQGIAKSQEPNLFAAGSRGKVDPVLWQSELDLEFPSLRKMYNAPEQALFYKALYKHGYLSRSSEDKKQYDAKASEGSNGFLEYIKIHSEEDGPKWKPKFNELVESYRNPR